MLNSRRPYNYKMKTSEQQKMEYDNDSDTE